MSTKSKSKPAEKGKKESASQSLVKKSGKGIMGTLSSVKAALVGSKSKGKDGKKATNGIYVKGITHKQTLDDIKSIFGAAGEITDCRRRSDKYALIWFADANSVKKAIDMFHHKPVENFVSKAESDFASLSINERARTSNPDLYAISKHGSSNVTKFIVQHADAAPAADRALYCKSVFVNGLPGANVLPNNFLRAAFAKYGKVVKVTRYNQSKFVFVYYADVASAVKAQKDISGKGLSNLLKGVEQPKPSSKGDKGKAQKKEAKPFVMPKPDGELTAELSVRTKERDDARETAARKHSKHNEEYKKWVRGTGF